MSARASANSATPATAAGATAVMLVLHGMCYMALSVPAVVAPVAALDFGVDASRVGVLIAVIYVFIMLAGLVCGLFTARWGIMRVCQASAAFSALGLLSAAAIGAAAPALAHWVTPAAFALLLFASIALLGYGMGLVNPISSQVLFIATPPQYRTVTFSIKQMGGPLGTAAAGIVLPALLLGMSWQPALVAMALPALLFVALAPAMPAYMCRYDEPAAGAPRGLSLAMLVEPIRIMWRTTPMRELAWASALLAMNQLSLSAFLVTYLNVELGMTLVAAGSLFALSQIAGLIGRVVFGVSAARWISPRRQLALQGLVSGICAVVLGLAQPHWPFAAIAVICVVFGATSLAWNGISLSEVARLAPAGKVGMATGGAQTFMSLGAIIGPIVFSALVAATGHYTTSFIACAIPVLILAVVLLASRPGNVADA